MEHGSGLTLALFAAYVASGCGSSAAGLARPPPSFESPRSPSAPSPRTPPAPPDSTGSPAPSPPGHDARRAEPTPIAEALDLLLGGHLERSWTTEKTLFLLGRRGKPADQLAALLRYPPAAQEAAIGGRVVTFAEVWAVREGSLAKVLARPVEVRPMVCEFDECAIVARPVVVSSAGEVVIETGSCPAALARLAENDERTTFTAFDGSVLPSVCKGAQRFAWSGAVFTPRAPAAPHTGAATFHQGDEALGAVVDALFPSSIQSRVEASWTSPRGDERFVAFRLTYPASSHGFFAHDGPSREWESGRSIDVTEVWLAREGAFRRVLQLPTGLRSLAEALHVLTLSVEPDGDLVTVRGPADDLGQTQEPSTPHEAALLRKDEREARRIQRGSGTYHFDGRTFVRRLATRRSSL